MNAGTNAALSVLLIDDDVELVRLLTQLLAREGIALRSATTGAAGLAGLSPLPSLVLLDLMLPDMHGKEVFRRLRERLPELPVIMLDGEGRPGRSRNRSRARRRRLRAEAVSTRRELIARVPVPYCVGRGPMLVQCAAHRQHCCNLASSCSTPVRARSPRIRSRIPLTNIEFRLLLELVKHPGLRFRAKR